MSEEISGAQENLAGPQSEGPHGTKCRFGDERYALLQSWSSGSDGSVSDVLRGLVDRERQRRIDEKWERPEPRTLKQKVASKVFDCFDLQLACVEAGVKFATVCKWMREDDAFRLEIDMHRNAYIARHEQWMLEQMRSRKPSMAAITAATIFLNAHHEAYGRTRIETVKQATAPLFKEFGQALKEEFGDASDQAERVLRKTRERYELRIAGKFSF